LTHEDRQQLDGGDWAAVERALSDVLAAVTQLDEAGYRGPYALALAPPLYNGLFRLYPGTDVSQIQHLRHLCTRGIYKAPPRAAYWSTRVSVPWCWGRICGRATSARTGCITSSI
jgi:uncharacterized linocin/CFP29 family protein